MRLTIHPFADQQREIDVTDALITAIAEEIWQECGGNGALNWLEAESQLSRILAETRAQSHGPGSVEPAHGASRIAGKIVAPLDRDHGDTIIPRPARKGPHAALSTDPCESSVFLG